MSIMSAPCEMSCWALLVMESWSLYWPPSKKESGVTLRMPIIRGCSDEEISLPLMIIGLD